MELLAPAGSMEALRAAVCNGADAVYLGAGTFNARMNARNFSAADLQEAIVYCHVRGVQVHLTLNTLVSDREMARAAEVIRAAAVFGVDAFIVQDLGMVQLCKEIAPSVPIHASTQMSIHSLEGVVAAAELGCSRVVLARELGMDEIREIRRRVDDALAAVGMENFAQHAPHLLSGGQKQRVAIAGILAMEPECIVLDEATAMLDPAGRREVIDTVLRLNRERGITVVLITHHMAEAERADRVIVMNDGQVAMDGRPRDVFAQVDELHALGLAAPDTVELLYRLQKAGLDVSLDSLTVDECADTICRALGAAEGK